MDLQTAIDYIVTQIDGLAETSIVLGYRALLADKATFENVYVSGGEVNVVEVNRRSTPRNYFASQRFEGLHEIEIHVYRGVDQGGGPSEVLHRATCEAISDLLSVDYRLGGNASRIWPVQQEEDTHIEKTGAFLHYGLLSLRAKIDNPFAT